MRREVIKTGDIIPTIEGYLIIKGRNDGGLFYCDNYIVDFDGEEWKDCERMLTKHELENTIKKIDGQNHNLWWEN